MSQGSLSPGGHQTHILSKLRYTNCFLKKHLSAADYIGTGHGSLRSLALTLPGGGRRWSRTWKGLAQSHVTWFAATSRTVWTEVGPAVTPPWGPCLEAVPQCPGGRSGHGGFPRRASGPRTDIGWRPLRVPGCLCRRRNPVFIYKQRRRVSV